MSNEQKARHIWNTLRELGVNKKQMIELIKLCLDEFDSSAERKEWKCPTCHSPSCGDIDPDCGKTPAAERASNKEG